MLQIMKYHFRILLRNREQMFWILLFPILLGIMFKVAFSNISSSEIQRPVSIAVVEENNSDALKNIKTFLEKTELKDGVALLDIYFAVRIRRICPHSFEELICSI